jgi:hypothetical protein
MAPKRASKGAKDMTAKELKEFVGFKGLARAKNLRRLAEDIEAGRITPKAAKDILKRSLILTPRKLDRLLKDARWEKSSEEALEKMKGWKEVIEVLPKYQQAHGVLEEERKCMEAAWKEYNTLRATGHKNPHEHVVEAAWKKVEESAKRFNEAWKRVKQTEKEAEEARKHI